MYLAVLKDKFILTYLYSEELDTQHVYSTTPCSCASVLAAMTGFRLITGE